MNIPITPIRQGIRADCFSICLKMILDYYQIPVETDELDKFFIKESTSFSLTGFLTDGALFARRKNLAVDCIGYSLYFTNQKDSSLAWHELLKKLEDRQPEITDSSFSQMLESIIRSIKYGARYLIQKPNLNTIYNYLDKGIPLIALVNSSFLRDEVEGDLYKTHAVVIKGRQDGKLYIIDPIKGEEELVDETQMLLAIMSTKWIVHPAYLIAIDNKSPVIE